LGAVGALLCAAILGAALSAIARRLAGVDRAAAAATLFTALFVASVSYGIWQGWWMGVYWLAGILLVAITDGPSGADDAAAWASRRKKA
jgi:hypothetical protein